MVRGKFSLGKLQVAKEAKISNRSTTNSVGIRVKNLSLAWLSS